MIKVHTNLFNKEYVVSILLVGAIIYVNHTPEYASAYNRIIEFSAPADALTAFNGISILSGSI